MTTIQDELYGYLLQLVNRPQMYAVNPLHAEGIIVTVMETLVALERQLGLTDAQKKVADGISKIVKDIPHNETQRIFLCEEAVCPKRIRKFGILKERTWMLWNRVLERPQNPSQAT